MLADYFCRPITMIDAQQHNKKKDDLSIILSAVWTGLEPATPCVTGRYSNQLNYHTIINPTTVIS